MDNRVRSFIAVEIENSDVFAKIASFRNSLKDLNLDAKFVEDENLHITIRFLGEVSIATVEEVKKILNRLAERVKVFELEVKGFGAFPNISRPRVLWVGISRGFEELGEMRRYIDSEISRIGLRDVHRDEHEFSPHITIARLRSFRNVDRLLKVYEVYKDYVFGVTPVTMVKLKQSTLTPSGPIYRDIHVVKLL